MTERSVVLSITMKLMEQEVEYEKEIDLWEVEGSLQGCTQEMTCMAHSLILEGMDKAIQHKVPGNWENVGREERGILTSAGLVRYKRRIYRDERGERRKPVDELMGYGRYERASELVKEMGAYLASEGTYRLAAGQLSWMVKRRVSAMRIQRMAWETGKRIVEGEQVERERVFEEGETLKAGKVEAPILYGESDGVWLHLQGEVKKSVEVRVGILSSGKKRVGKGRFRLENKCCVTGIVQDSQEWQEILLKAAHQTYDLQKTRLLVSGGDGNQWVRHSFQRFEMREEFILDRFHLERAARHVLGRGVETRRLLSTLYEKGVGAIEKDLAQRIAQAEGGQQKELIRFYHYLQSNQKGLQDLKYRNCPEGIHAHTLGAIEGNVDKLVVHRMKGRGCSWRLSGAQAMLALCRHKAEIRDHVYHYLPTQSPVPVSLVKSAIPPRTHQAGVPLFRGPDQGVPWVQQLKRSLYGKNSLFYLS
ncbi:MAG: hypothetical protein EG828_12475 [Deltaproteobacteria bacterium]|nr:hypothetical protein [Deltaproteobacteria bacterium]